MGYDLYITKADFFWQTNEFPIEEAEWLAVASDDSSLRQSATDYYEFRQPDGTLVRIQPWLWLDHPEVVPLWYMDGAVSTKNPDKLTVRKLAALAAKLNARVIGEEGEVYGADGEQVAPIEKVVPQRGGLVRKLLRLFSRR